jgi:hypothetical protein
MGFRPARQPQPTRSVAGLESLTDVPDGCVRPVKYIYKAA